MFYSTWAVFRIGGSDERTVIGKHARDLTGEKFERLTVVEFVGFNKYRDAIWKCVCDCGREKNVPESSLLKGHSKSCGCLHSEVLAERNRRNRRCLTGQRFGRLVVLGNAEPDKYGASRYLCKCDCGNEKIVGISQLKRGTTSSCGCMKIKYGVSKKGENARLMRIWDGMRDRCLKKHDPNYHNYGGRGITICDEWTDDFWEFCKWARGHGYADDLQIDRIDNDGPYSPSNCRWVTPKNNSRNRRNNVNLTVHGKTQCISAWHEETGVNRSAMYYWTSSHGKEFAEAKLLTYIEAGPSERE